MSSKRTKSVSTRARTRRTLPPAYVSSTAMVVSDRSKAAEWYTERLGLDLLESFDHWVTVGRKGKGGRLHLCQVSEYDTSAPMEPGNSGVQLRIPGTDFAEACRRIQANGVEFSVEPVHESWGWYAVVRDPDGNEIALAPDV